MAEPLHAQSSDVFVTMSGPASANPGNNVTYSVTLGNGGPDAAPNATLNVTLPAGGTFVSEAQSAGTPFPPCTTPAVGASGGTVTCTIASLPSGASAIFSITINASAGAAGTTLIASATVASDNPDPNPENNTSTSGTSISGGNLSDVGVTKTGPSNAVPGSNITYTITVSDFGPNDASSVTLNDTLGAGLTFVSLNQVSGPAFSCPGNTTPCTIATLPNGSSAVFHLIATVSSTSGTYTNTASVTSANDPNPDNDSASSAVTASSADVGVTKSGPATAIAGGPAFSYSITLSNSGPDSAQNASFNDPFPAGVTFVSLVQNTGPTANCLTPAVGSGGTVTCNIPALLNGQSGNFTVTVRAAGSVANGTILTNTATASASSPDPNPNNNSSSASTTISSQADLAITKTGPAGVTAGNNATYTLTLINNGPAYASNVALTDALPAGETFVSLVQTAGPTFTCTTGGTINCSLASLASGTSATFTLVAAVSGGLTNGSTVSNTANVSSGTPDPVPGNNSSTSSATVGATADLAVTKTASYGGAVGGNIVYTLGIVNNGPSTASAVQLSDTLPATTRFVSLTQSGGPAFSCTTPALGAGGTVNCTSATLAVGATATFLLTVDTAAASLGATVVNTATASSTTSDPNAANNAASATVTLSAQPAAPTPALNWVGLLLLAALLSIAAMRRRADFQR